MTAPHGPKPQPGMPNRRYHVANAPASHERTFDVLRCDRGANHDVRDEWETRGGLRTGRLIMYCHTCRRSIDDAATPNGQTAERSEILRRIAQQRRTAIERLAEARQREADILTRRQNGETNLEVAAALGITPQRASQLACRAKRRTAWVKS